MDLRTQTTKKKGLKEDPYNTIFDTENDNDCQTAVL
jgi:hypothetical protein